MKKEGYEFLSVLKNRKNRNTRSTSRMYVLGVLPFGAVNQSEKKLNISLPEGSALPAAGGTTPIVAIR